MNYRLMENPKLPGNRKLDGEQWQGEEHRDDKQGMHVTNYALRLQSLVASMRMYRLRGIWKK